MRRLSIMTVVILFASTCTSPASAEQTAAYRLALQFTKFCLGRLTQAEISRRASELGLYQTKQLIISDTLITSWKEANRPAGLRYSLM